MTTGTNLAILLNSYLHNDISFSSTDRLTYLTLGQQRIVRDEPTKLATKEATITTAAGTREYSLATDFYMMQGIWLQANGWKLDPYLDAEFIETVERIPTIPSGPPTGYTVLGYDETIGTPAFRIRFNYNPDDIYAIKYWYYYMPAAVSSATPAISAMGFDELLLWAATMIALQPKDPEGSATAMQNYLLCLDAFRSYRPMGPDYHPTFRAKSQDQRPRSPLGPHYPGL